MGPDISGDVGNVGSTGLFINNTDLDLAAHLLRKIGYNRTKGRMPIAGYLEKYFIVFSIHKFHTGPLQCSAGNQKGGPGVGHLKWNRSEDTGDRKSTRLNSSHVAISYAVS